MKHATLLLALFLLPGMARADDPLEKIRLDYYRDASKPPPIRGYDHHYTNLFDSINSTDKKWTGLVLVSSPQHGSIVFPTLKNEEIVPMFGALYRYETPDLVRLKDTKGLSIEKDSFVIPLQRDYQGSGQITYRNGVNSCGKTVFVTAIAPGEKPVAKVKIDDIRGEARENRKGDMLKLGPTEWDVRNIVPSGDGAIGWVELGPRK